MRIDAKILQMRISRLKQLIADTCIPTDAPEEIRHVLNTAPTLLRDVEVAIQSNDPMVLAQGHDLLKTIETYIEWVMGTISGRIMAEAIKSGKDTHPSLNKEQRLNNRITRFLMTKIDGPKYLSLVREFAGEDAVEGNTVYMDPIGETEDFSQWLLHDTVLPGESQRIIDLFAIAERATLPPDEQDLLRMRLADRPSIYRVVKLSEDRKTLERNDIYLVQDLLSLDDIIRIKDRSTSRSLQRGSVFIGRALPIYTKDCLYCLMGTITELPNKLWSILSGSIDKLLWNYLEKNPGSTAQDFFRIHHARLRREIRNMGPW